MKRIVGYHHFKGNELDSVGEIERKVVRIIAESQITDEQHESSKCWELKHSSGVIQLARLLAQRRGLDEAIAAIALALHDIYVIETGHYKNHALLGAPIAKRILETVPNLDGKAIETILRMITEHSAKEVVSDDPYVELAKDVDVLDCFLYPDAEQFYLTAKPIEVCKYYFRRIARIRQELGLPRYPRYECLENVAPGWLSYRGAFPAKDLPAVVARLFPSSCYDPKSDSQPVAAFLGSLETEFKVFSASPVPSSSEGDNRPEIAEIVRQLSAEGLSLLVCWPAFDAYEVLQGAYALERLANLGAYLPPELGTAKGHSL